MGPRAPLAKDAGHHHEHDAVDGEHAADGACGGAGARDQVLLKNHITGCVIPNHIT